MNFINNIIHPYNTFCKIIFLFFKHKLKKCGKNVMMNSGFDILEPERIEIGNNVRFGKNFSLKCYHKYLSDINKYDTNICIGNNINFGSDSFISCINNITIADGCLFGDNLFIADNFHGNGTLIESEIPPSKRNLFSKGPVVIGKNVWVGRNVCIMPNVKIGDYSIIGANSVVTHDIPAYSVVAGVPTKIVKKIKCNDCFKEQNST